MSKNLIPNFMFIFCLIMCCLFCFLGFQKLYYSEYQYLTSIGNNWKTGPISNIITSLNCPSGYSPILNDSWEGIKPGCYCPLKPILTSISYGNCPSKYLSTTCQKIYPISPVNLKTWKGMNLCAKRGPNYLDLKTASHANLCGMGYKSCGIIDTLNNVLCYPENIECPYNYIKAINKNDIIPTDRNYTVLTSNSTDTKFIFSNQEINGKILNQFKIDENTPCLSPDYKNFNIKHYVLEDSSGKTTCENKIANETLDYSYVKIDSENYETLYKDNEILEKIIKLPNFSLYSYLNLQTNLFYKNYVGMQNICKENLKGKLQSDEIIQGLIDMDRKISQNIAIFLIGFIFSIVGFVLYLIFMFFLFMMKEEEFSYTCFYIMRFLLINLPLLTLSISEVVKIINTNLDTEMFTDPKCTDKITSTAVMDFSNNLNSAKIYSFLFLGFTVLLTNVNIIGLFC